MQKIDIRKNFLVLALLYIGDFLYGCRIKCRKKRIKKKDMKKKIRLRHKTLDLIDKKQDNTRINEDEKG